MSTPSGRFALVVRSRRDWLPSVSRGLLRIAGAALVAAGFVTALHGVVLELYRAVEGPGQPLVLSVQIRDLDRLRVQQATSPGSQTVLPIRLQQGFVAPGLHLYVDGVSSDNWLEAATGPTPLHVVGATAPEQALHFGGSAVAGLCFAWGSLFGRRLLLSIARGQPFERENAGRFALIAVLVVIAALAADLLPYQAARLALGRLGAGGSDSPVSPHLAISPVPFLLALLLLVLAEAFRRGTELASHTQGPG